MATMPATGELDARFSDAHAEATPWPHVQLVLDEAETFWLATVRPDGRPHVTTLIAVWQDEAAWFCTGPDERKARNLAVNPWCTLTTGRNELGTGLDVVLEGRARQVDDPVRLRTVADAYVAKYGHDWAFAVEDGAFAHADGGRALVFALAPTTIFGFRKGEVFSQTRWRP